MKNIGYVCKLNKVINVFVYGLLRGLARNLANKNRIESPRGFS